LGSIPAIYKEDSKKPQNADTLNRTDKLSGDIKPASAQDVLDVHNAPTDLQEG
jgi:hypothetical protein